MNTFNHSIFEDYKNNNLSKNELINLTAKTPHSTTITNSTCRATNSNYEQTDLRLSIRLQDLDLISHFIDRGDTLQEYDCYHHDPLIYALNNGYLTSAEYILTHYSDKINFNNLSYNGLNALFIFLSRNKYLIDDLKIIEHHKKTPISHELLAYFSVATDGLSENSTYYDLFSLPSLSHIFPYDLDHKNLQYLNIYQILKNKQNNITDPTGLDILLNVAISNYYFLPQLIKDGYNYSIISTDKPLMMKRFVLLKSHEKADHDFFLDFASLLLNNENVFVFHDKLLLLDNALHLIQSSDFQFGYREDIENAIEELKGAL